MKFVQPIRDMEKIFEIQEFLLEQNERNYMLFVTGIYTGLRISDILRLKVKDVRGQYIDIREKKTNKQKNIRIIPEFKRELNRYITGKDDDEYLFRSRKGKNKPLQRSMAYKVLRSAAFACGLKNIGTHTLRKTFGYHMYMSNKDVAMLQEIFNHSEPKTTLRYIGVTQDSIDKAMSKLSFKRK
ncbi:site-specific integrase [Alkalihalophilus pseudofirmus]|jgi:integrase|uniref:site-specific integrase n=1 Tax=Alkalihalophilus pseudofirmus TaxID=79885 RepID=UPI000952CFE2|nr:site-specific integrase [Alkalihalophilus pseudofirmus]